jgi:hypothetical protein
MRLAPLAAALLLLAGCTGGEHALPRPSGGATPSATATASPSTIQDVDRRLYVSDVDAALHFRSPTGNIVCSLGSESDADFLSCVIREHTWKSRCSQRQYVEVEIGQSADELAHLRCGDAAPAGDDRVLPYNRAISGINIRCTSTVDGITCEDGNEPHGRFFLSRAAYRLS